MPHGSLLGTHLGTQIQKVCYLLKPKEIIKQLFSMIYAHYYS